MKSSPSILPVLRVFWEHARRYKLAVFLAVFFSIGVHVVEIIIPLYYKRFFDILAIAGSPSSDAYRQLLAILGSIAILFGVSWVFRRIDQFASKYLQPHIMADLMRTSFAYLEGHSYKFFSDSFAGSLVRRVNRMARSFERIADQIQFTYIPLVVTIGGISVVLFFRHALLGSIFLGWVVVLVIVQYALARWKLKYNIALAAKDSETTGILSDSITNITTVKTFTGEEYENSIFYNVTEELRRLRFKTWSIDEYINLTQGLLFIAVELGLIYATLRLWREGVATIGDFALIQAYVIRAFDHMWHFGQTLRKSYEDIADAYEMVEILEKPHGITDKPKARRLCVTNGAIDFADVTFNFQETRSVLTDFNLSIEGGEKVALVGPSGAGKTTVTKLLFRFYDVTSGKILIDGKNVADVTQESLRTAVSLVPQEPILFHRTLMENIHYGRRDATDKEIMEAARQAHCDDFISKLPARYDTYVGERGVKLSGGERQRVAIARAILRNAPILVLDEATSSLDSESEMFIQDGLSVLMEGRTVIVIAHRLSTIMKMDRIIVMEEGDITAMGTHEELLQQGGTYKKLWEIQAGGFIG
ncbi:MAG: ATP-binding cassette, subfamily B, bacterial [Parcubacteria group bacterium Gr01-1014_29]|nr:MAG: ATP-binding cassette, subfamily B, bacterial [Parcubacteria group bacterium Gr01-1014_29]